MMKVLKNVYSHLTLILLLTVQLAALNAAPEQTVSFKNSNDQLLAGSLWQASSEIIIIMAHGNGLNRYFFNSLAPALHTAGYDVLTFDFAGQGESQDAVITLEGAALDTQAAIAFCNAQGYQKFILVGHSLGAYGCLRACNSSVKTIMCLGGLCGPLVWTWEQLGCTPEQIAALQTTGYHPMESPTHPKRILKLDKEFFTSVAHIQQKELFETITCPVLFIHGDDTDFLEKPFAESSQQALALLPSAAKLVRIPGASHLFSDEMGHIIQLMTDWLSKYSPVKKKQGIVNEK